MKNTSPAGDRACRPPAMPQLYQITVPGVEVISDWAAVRDRLLDDFPAVTDVLATTIPATVLIVYEGRAEADAWLERINEAVLRRRLSLRLTTRRRESLGSWRKKA